ncbi:MAG: glycine zipper family protein [Thiotrichales bacterium]
MQRALRLFPFAAAPLLAACIVMPTGPSVMALPGTGRGFDTFRHDDALCRGYAQEHIGGYTAQTAANEAAVGSAVVGTVVGAAAGAAIGGHSGAGVGAGAGLLVGSTAGTSAANVSAYSAQSRYDASYVQCMYAKGHRVPVSGHFTGPAAPSKARIPPPPPRDQPPANARIPPPPPYDRSYPPPPP